LILKKLLREIEKEHSKTKKEFDEISFGIEARREESKKAVETFEAEMNDYTTQLGELETKKTDIEALVISLQKETEEKLNILDTLCEASIEETPQELLDQIVNLKDEINSLNSQIETLYSQLVKLGKGSIIIIDSVQQSFEKMCVSKIKITNQIDALFDVGNKMQSDNLPDCVQKIKNETKKFKSLRIDLNSQLNRINKYIDSDQISDSLAEKIHGLNNKADTSKEAMEYAFGSAFSRFMESNLLKQQKNKYKLQQLNANNERLKKENVNLDDSGKKSPPEFKLIVNSKFTLLSSELELPELSLIFQTVDISDPDILKQLPSIITNEINTNLYNYILNICEGFWRLVGFILDLITGKGKTREFPINDECMEETKKLEEKVVTLQQMSDNDSKVKEQIHIMHVLHAQFECDAYECVILMNNKKYDYKTIHKGLIDAFAYSEEEANELLAKIGITS
jgi:hypothetical protein